MVHFVPFLCELQIIVQKCRHIGSKKLKSKLQQHKSVLLF